MTRTPRLAASGASTLAQVAVLAVLCAATTSLGACRPAAPVPDGASDGKVAVTSTLGAAAAAASATTVPAGGAEPAPTVATNLTAEDEQAMVALIRTLFGPAIGTTEPDMQGTIVRQVSTTELSALRGDKGPDEGVVGYSAGYVWVVGFKTSAPLTRATFMSDPSADLALKDLGLTDSLAGPDGLTSVFYIVVTQSVDGNRRFVPRSQGVLVEGQSKWSLEDLAKLPVTP